MRFYPAYFISFRHEAERKAFETRPQGKNAWRHSIHYVEDIFARERSIEALQPVVIERLVKYAG